MPMEKVPSSGCTNPFITMSYTSHDSLGQKSEELGRWMVNWMAVLMFGLGPVSEGFVCTFY